MKLRRLPDELEQLLGSVDAPARLVAHLTLVHDVARTLIARYWQVFARLDDVAIEIVARANAWLVWQQQHTP